MNSVKNILVIVLLTLAFSSCNKEFLEREPTQLISKEQIEQVSQFNNDIFNAGVRGLYVLMYQTGTGGTTSHDDFGQKGYDIYLDLLSGDMTLAGYNYGWYRDLATYASTVDYTDVDNYKPWRYYYRLIRAANDLIDGMGGNNVVPEQEDIKHAMGQAKAMRGYSYFYLANMYANEFDLSKEILPIYTIPSDSAVGLSTGQVIWDQIIKDLEDAVSLLDGFYTDVDEKYVIDEFVAKGMLAYAYLTISDYTKAAATAQSVIDDGGYTILPMDELTTNGFNDVRTPSWIWGMDLTLDQGLDLVSWWGQADVFTYSYAAVGDAKTMDSGLFNSIRAKDARKNWFGAIQEVGIPYCPINKFFDDERQHFTQRNITSDYVYMRIEEMYLIKAEAEAKLNMDDKAKATLKVLIEERDSVPSFLDALSGQALKDEIYKQWRIEMWGEGKSYLALKRNKANVFRQGHIDLNGITIPYNDERLSFKIPFQEVQDNPHISNQ